MTDLEQAKLEESQRQTRLLQQIRDRPTLGTHLKHLLWLVLAIIVISVLGSLKH